MNTLTECVVSTLSPAVVRALTDNAARGDFVTQGQGALTLRYVASDF